MGITVEGFPCHSVLFCLLQIVDMARQRVVAVEVFYLLSPRPAHLAKRFVLLHARKPASAEIGGYPRRGAAAEGIEYPVALIGRARIMRTKRRSGFCVGCLPQVFSQRPIAGMRHTSVICLPSLSRFINS